MADLQSKTKLKGHEALGCPGVEAMQLLEQKWTLQILRALSEGRKRFCGLQQTIGDLNSVTLSRRLRQMEEEAIVVREVLNDIPPWVEYELTEKGQDLNAIIEAVERWGLKWASQSREKSESRPPPLKRT